MVGKQFNRVATKGVQFREEEDSKTSAAAAGKKPSGPMTSEQRKAEAEKKKKAALQQSKLKRKKSETLDSKMSSVVKLPKEKTNERQQKMREELSKYIREVLLEDVITAAQCYGESLLVGRSI